jgi:rhodanese-related sulfurtransferase
MWLAKQGYKNIFNVSGGIDAYARKVDPSVGVY